jgi:hypothetical protein
MSAPSRLLLCALAALALAAPAQAAVDAAGSAQVGAPQGLRPFQLLASETVKRSFDRTPSFAWTPVAGAKRYEFQLATSRTFADNAVLWEADGLTSPAVAIPIALPWITGSPYSLYAHVRAITTRGVSAWSKPFGFDMRAAGVPQPLQSVPGLLRWSTVPGASGYSVWLVDAAKIFSTRTNVADEREYYTFHQSQAWAGTVHWRVRAERYLYGGTSIKNGLPAVSYGRWSPVYTSYNPPFYVGGIGLGGTVSDTVSTPSHELPHALMPAFFWNGDQSIDGSYDELYRVYVFTDKDCLNIVYRGALVGSPAYAPRPTGPLGLPADDAALTLARGSFLPDGSEGTTYTADYLRVTTSEVTGPATSTPPAGGDSGGNGSSTTGGQAGAGTSIPIEQTVQGAKVDLWDTDPSGGGYYWTVMPVRIVQSAAVASSLAAGAASGASQIKVASTTSFTAGDTLRLGSGANQEDAIVGSISGSNVTLLSPLKFGHAIGEAVIKPGGNLEYRDEELTQDACASGRVLTFRKSSAPALTESGRPFASGLSPTGRLVAASSGRPSFYGAPLVAWQPASGAAGYELQWSRTPYPWRKAGSIITPATSAVLSLKPGRWYYRVRGIDLDIPGARQGMTWSTPVSIRIAKPTFRVVRGR